MYILPLQYHIIMKKYISALLGHIRQPWSSKKWIGPRITRLNYLRYQIKLLTRRHLSLVETFQISSDIIIIEYYNSKSQYIDVLFIKTLVFLMSLLKILHIYWGTDRRLSKRYLATISGRVARTYLYIEEARTESFLL